MRLAIRPTSVIHVLLITRVIYYWNLLVEANVDREVHITGYAVAFSRLKSFVLQVPLNITYQLCIVTVMNGYPVNKTCAVYFRGYIYIAIITKLFIRFDQRLVDCTKARSWKRWRIIAA